MSADAASFEAHRAPLVRHAYRMLGEYAEAEDVVQDAFLRWHAARGTATIGDDRAYLRATVTRLCIDRLRSARARREVYVGPWLPEPLVTQPSGDPADAAVLADDVSFGLLLALDRLSPLERAAFLLHDVMQVPFAEIAATLGRSEHAVKQLASRARTHVRERRPRRDRNPPDALGLCERFGAAIRNEDLGALQTLLAEDVVFVGDSGGKVPAASVPVSGRDHVGRLLLGLARKAPPEMRITTANINGSPGFIVFIREHVVQTLALELADGRIAALYATRNPDKLRGIYAAVEAR